MDADFHGRDREPGAGRGPEFPNMSNIPADLRYAKTHEWLRRESDGTVTVGITDYAQNSLGDITFVQLPKVGASFRSGEAFGVVESVKAAADVYMPISGTVTEVNEALRDDPSLANTDPLAAGWFFKVKLANPSEVDALLDETAYKAFSAA